MQTPGLSSSSPTSSHSNAAKNLFSDNPSHAAEHFGDVMSRALTPRHNSDGNGNHRADAQSHQSHRSPFENDLKAKSKDSTEKTDTDRKHAAPARKSDDASALLNSSFIGLAVPTTPAPRPIPAQPTGNSHKSPQTDDSVTPLSAEPTNTTVKDAAVTDADSTDPKAEDSTAKAVPAGMEPHSADTDGAIEHPQNPLSPETTQALAALAAEATTEPAEPTLPGDSDPALNPIPEAKTGVDPKVASSKDSHGTPAAKHDMTMKKAEKMQKVAGPAEQDLPGNTASGSEELPKGQKVSEKAASHGEKIDSTPIELPTRVSTSVEAPSVTITSATATPSANMDTRVLERTHDIVALHAMRLTDTGAESLHVVVKPGAGIQISLELRQRARGIEVSASLHKGDYAQLNQHWPDLQQRLEARGVRVSSLPPSENYTGTGQQIHQSKQQTTQQETQQADANTENTLAGSVTEASAARAARASAYRGWET